ncbi:MAG: M48 family metallopeptidase [Gammaproteobacteria bacterium]|nr:M48 family metallopeptidase [Gammaproteobacteria bacterium]
MIKRPWHAISLVLIGLIVSACATTPTGRQQLQIFPDSQMRALGARAYADIREKESVIASSEQGAYVQCVTDAMLAALPPQYVREQWEVSVFESEQVNAFALPGGKMGVYSGLLEVAENQDQLATVIAHEIAHVMARHGNERVSTQFATVAGLSALQIAAGDDADRQRLLAALGVGAHLGIILPFSRLHESEADAIGLGLMADAGFDPREAVNLWRNMARAGGAQPPTFLSTHPSSGRRISDLQTLMPEAMPLYERAQAQGRRPDC